VARGPAGDSGFVEGLGISSQLEKALTTGGTEVHRGLSLQLTYAVGY
jgi:hypothetical protein